MNNIRSNMDRYIDKLDQRWQVLPVRKQCRYTCYFFMGYLLLTAAVIFNVWHEIQASDNDMAIEHIENPVFKKIERSSSMEGAPSTDNPKNKTYERK